MPLFAPVSCPFTAKFTASRLVWLKEKAAVVSSTMYDAPTTPNTQVK
jgi:hypothetical protein